MKKMALEALHRYSCRPKDQTSLCHIGFFTRLARPQGDMMLTYSISASTLHIRGSRIGARLFPHLRVVWSNGVGTQKHLLSKSTNACNL